MLRTRFKKHYDHIVRYDELLSTCAINVFRLPALKTVSLNVNIGKVAVSDRKQVILHLLVLEVIAGQRPCIVEAKASIDKFKLREGMPIGCKVTLRKKNAFLYLDRLFLFILPKIRLTGDSTRLNSAKIRDLPRYSATFGLTEKDLYAYEEILGLVSASGESSSRKQISLGGCDVNIIFSSGEKGARP